MEERILRRWFAACEENRPDDVWELLQQTPELIGAADALGENALHKAAYRGVTEVATMLLEARIRATHTNQEGQTALHLAVRGGCPAMAETLIAAGLPVNAVDGAGRSALFYARSARMVEVLLAHRVDVRLIDATGGNVLHWAVQQTLPDTVGVVRALLQGNALATAKDRAGNTPLHLDVTGESIWLLLGAGSRVNMLNQAGQSALELAIRRGSEHAVRVLLNGGAVVTQGSIRDALEHILHPELSIRRRIQALLEPHLVKMVPSKPPVAPPPPAPSISTEKGQSGSETISLLPPRVLAARRTKVKK